MDKDQETDCSSMKAFRFWHHEITEITKDFQKREREEKKQEEAEAEEEGGGGGEKTHT